MSSVRSPKRPPSRVGRASGGAFPADAPKVSRGQNRQNGGRHPRSPDGFTRVYCFTSSTRRLLAFPSAVSLVSIGFDSPCPTASNRPPSILYPSPR